MTLSTQDLEHFMREAIEEGKKAYPTCLPNPPVGCVLVRDGKIIARGHTQRPFEHHAEPMALSQVEGDLQDVTAFVTLEPCSFHERTPSCAKEMIARNIGATYVAMLDPHPKNQGRGIEMLRESGMTVVANFLAEEARPHLEPYLYKPTPEHRAFFLKRVADELLRQGYKWGEQNHPSFSGNLSEESVPSKENAEALASLYNLPTPQLAKAQCEKAAQDGTLTWMHILMEEVAECLEADNVQDLQAELIQVAAVAINWAECLERNKPKA